MYVFIAFILSIILITLIILIVYFSQNSSNKLFGNFTKTNYDMCLGKEGIVTEKISNINATGQIKINGQIWSAKSLNDDEIEVGEIVTAEKIDGVKIIVKRKRVIK